jgi:hypothetical protein
MATAESVSVRLFGETLSSGATAVGVSSWPGWESLPDSLSQIHHDNEASHASIQQSILIAAVRRMQEKSRDFSPNRRTPLIPDIHGLVPKQV